MHGPSSPGVAHPAASPAWPRAQYKAIVDWCGCSPNVFMPFEKGRLVTHSKQPTFFARKFDPRLNLEIINFVERKMLGITNGRCTLQPW